MAEHVYKMKSHDFNYSLLMKFTVRWGNANFLYVILNNLRFVAITVTLKYQNESRHSDISV